MGMVVRTNTMATNAYRSLSANQSAVAKSLEKLSSGFRINRAGDDASGLSISEKMKAQIKGLEQASANSQDGISLVQTAEGALTEVHSMLNRMVELATKSANGTIQDEVDREAIQTEIDALNTEITRISKSTNFNGINLLDGTMGKVEGAFVESAVDAVGAEAIALVGKFGTVLGVTTKLGSQSVAEVAPSFEVDLVDLSFDLAGDDTDTITLSIGGTAMTVTGQIADGDGDGKASASELATAILATNATFDYEGARYTVGTSGTKLTFTYASQDDGSTTEIDDTVLSPSGAVTFAPGAGLSNQIGDVNPATINVTNPVIAVDGARAYQSFTLDDTVLADGNKLTIDGKTFVFKTDADSAVTAGAGETLIDVSALDAADQIAEAVDLLSQYSTDNFEIGASSDNTIYIDQKVGNTNLYDSEEKLNALFKAETPSTGAGTKLTIDATKLKAGNAIRIDGKTYEFVGEGGSADIDGAIAVEVAGLTSKAGSATNQAFVDALNTALGAGVLDSDATSITIDANSAITGGGLTIQIGDTADAFNKVTVSVDDLSAEGLGIAGLDVSSQTAAAGSIETIKAAINMVSTNRGNLGALQNRLEHAINNLDATAENMQAANSRIRDTDMAKEMMNYTKQNILAQAAQAMLAQANQQPQAILQLLQ